MVQPVSLPEEHCYKDIQVGRSIPSFANKGQKKRAGANSGRGGVLVSRGPLDTPSITSFI
jgi:hypothetical protein